MTEKVPHPDFHRDEMLIKKFMQNLWQMNFC